MKSKAMQTQFLAKFSQADYRDMYRLALVYLHERRNMGESAVAEAWLEASLHHLLKKNLILPIDKDIK